MKRKQKRYTKPYEIEMEIIKERKRANALEHEAMGFDSMAKAALKKLNDMELILQPGEVQFMTEQVDVFKKKAHRKRVTADNILQVKIKSLGATLAALKTQPMPFISDDSVVLQK